MERSGTFPGDGAVPVDVIDAAGPPPGRMWPPAPDTAGGPPVPPDLVPILLRPGGAVGLP